MLELPQRHRQTLLALLAQYVPQADVWAFGSRVTGKAHEGSDIDLVVRQPLHPETTTTDLSPLRLALQESSLPVLVDVHDWADLPPSFRDEISRQYMVIRRPGDLPQAI
jgi:predicted nucleotidyltransferase